MKTSHIKKMDNVYYFYNSLYIRIHIKNIEIIKTCSVETLISQLLIWDIKYNIIEPLSLAKRCGLNLFNNSEYQTFIDKCLNNVRYKVYFKISDCSIK